MNYVQKSPYPAAVEAALLPAVSGLDSKSAGGRVFAVSVAPFGLQAIGSLGWSKDSSQPIGLGFCS